MYCIDVKSDDGALTVSWGDLLLLEIWSYEMAIIGNKFCLIVSACFVNALRLISDTSIP